MGRGSGQSAATEAGSDAQLSATVDDLDRFFAERGLRVPPGLRRVFGSPLPGRLRGHLCLPTEDEADARSPSMAWAELVIDGTEAPLAPNLVPLLALDEQSFACVVAASVDGAPLTTEGMVVRWHLALSPDRADHQAALLDTDCYLYIESVAEELAARQPGLDRMLNEIGPAYELEYLDGEKRPRDFVLRPVRLACQNVIVGLAALRHDAAINGMAVLSWQTCEVPHVVAHEGNRAMAALMLCDTFQSGGTMEIRFDRPARLSAAGTLKRSGRTVKLDCSYAGHPEGKVPASLRRYGRSVGVALGEDVSLGARRRAAISPLEARQLFLAVTPMTDGLRRRVDETVMRGAVSPERLCYVLLSAIWRDIEVDFMLAVSPRTPSIISGGADWRQRADRQAESEVARAALMLGMLHRRLDATDRAAGGVVQLDGAVAETRLVEDARAGVTWDVLDDAGAIRFGRLRAAQLPWQREGQPLDVADGSELVVLPRTHVSADDVEAALAFAGRTLTVIVVPQDYEPPVAVQESKVLLLFCPDRLPELDREIEARLLSARVSRA